MMATNDKFLIVGSSNIRNAFSGKLGKLGKTVGCTAEYLPATSLTAGYAALKTTTEVTILLVSFLLNGITDATELCVDSESIDNTMNRIIDEYCLAILEFGKRHPDARCYVLPPLFRSTPTWMADKITYIGDRIKSNLPSSLGIFHIPSILIVAADLHDGVHLNYKTQVTLFEHITSFIFPNIVHSPRESIKRRADAEDSELEGAVPKALRGDSSVAALSTDDAMMVDSNSTETVHSVMPAEGRSDMTGSSTSLDNPLNSFDELKSCVAANSLKINAHNVCIKELLYQTANQADISDMLCNINNLNQVIISGIRENPFGLGMLPRIKPVAHKLVLATKVHIGAIKTAVVQKYPLPRQGCLPDMKIIFNSGEAGTLFRADANRLRKDKVGEWGSIYVNNEVTKATKVRIALLQSIASALGRLPSNVGKTVFVTKFESRPQLCIKSGDRIERRFFFVEAIQKYQTLLKEADLANGRKIAGRTFDKGLTPTFIVL